MKLVVTGATGLVGTECIRLAILNPSITKVIALARRPVAPPEQAGSDTSKLQSVVLEDWTKPYPDTVKESLRGADACIWTLAVTPNKAREMDSSEVTKICREYTTNGLENMAAVANKPFRFVYTSGVMTERDQSKSLTMMGDYRKMRGSVESALLKYASQHAPNIEVTVTKPGGIDGPGRENVITAAMTSFIANFGFFPKIHVSELSAVMIDQCLNGITKEPLECNDMAEIAKKILKKEDYAK